MSDQSEVQEERDCQKRDFDETWTVPENDLDATWPVGHLPELRAD